MIAAICIGIVGATSIAILPTDTVTLSWTHTVEGTRWEEDYAISNRKLVIREARVKRSGAGMDAPSDAMWSGGWWHYVPSLGPLPQVVLANSVFAPGYRVCWGGKCSQLNDMLARSSFVKLEPRPCNSDSSSASD
jgi:hypothetical protein